MFRRKHIVAALAGAVTIAVSPARAQEAAEPAGQSELPQVEVIQKKKAAPAAAKKKAAPVQASSPAPQPPPPAFADVADDSEPLENSFYGSPASSAAAQRAQSGPLSPVNPRSILPGDLQNAQGAASRITTAQLEAQRAHTTHEALARVPGVITVTDDGFARHSGIGVRGSPFRRSRKVLVMEDGVPINFSPYLDSSTHYTPPLERIESVEVFRGPVVNYGPLNNHGVINFRNLSPFGGNETVIKAGIGTTEGSDRDINNFRHVHTRQNLGNVGVVASYSGADAGGAWDVEDLGYNDFYGAIGLRGSRQDLTISGGFFRQRDTYDEDNFEGSVTQFNQFRRRKVDAAQAGLFAVECCYDWSSYNADYYRFQLAHNLYINDDTTLSTRIYGNDHERARFYVDEYNGPADFQMAGRDRVYRNYGADSRIEFANLNWFGLTHDVQAGIRYEEHRFTNTDRIGGLNERLSFGNRGAVDEGPQKLAADSFAAFVQSAIRLTPMLTVTPGVRFESYDVSFRDLFGAVGAGGQSYDHVLPMLCFAWEAMPRTTLYGGYHRGLTPHIIRDAIDPLDQFEAPPEEIGDNFELGVRTTAIRGLTLDMAYFHNRIENYQFGEAFQSLAGDRVFTSLDEVSINGFEIYSRLDSNPFTGGPWNVFGEAVYTFADAEIERGVIEGGIDVSGKTVPEAIRHFANLTAGLQYKKLWDASVTWTHRGSFFTDAENIGFSPDAEDGEVESVWLLSARANYNVTEQLTLWASGQNLTDEFYVSDRSDGAKPGLGRTVMGGFTLKFD